MANDNLKLGLNNSDFKNEQYKLSISSLLSFYFLNFMRHYYLVPGYFFNIISSSFVDMNESLAAAVCRQLKTQGFRRISHVVVAISLTYPVHLPLGLLWEKRQCCSD